MKIKTLVLGTLMTNLIFQLSPSAQAVEKLYPMTPAKTIEVKVLTPAMAMQSKSTQKNYFKGRNTVFRPLFNFLQDNQLAMTSPVEVDVHENSMQFYIAPDTQNKDRLHANNQVKLIQKQNRMVVAIGLTGAYSESNYLKGLSALEQWLQSQSDYTQIDPAYAVYWNPPFVPDFIKRSEIHIPIKLVNHE